MIREPWFRLVSLPAVQWPVRACTRSWGAWTGRRRAGTPPRPFGQLCGDWGRRVAGAEQNNWQTFKFCKCLISQFSTTFSRAPSRLYRSRSLQVNTKYAFCSIFQALQDLHTSFSWPFHRRPFSLKYHVVHFLFLRVSAYVSIRS